MSTKKVQNYPYSTSSKTHERFQNVVLIDDNSIDLFINETILRAAGISRFVHVKSDPAAFISELNATDRLSNVPELIFINLEMKGISGFDFISEFAKLSDFIRNKCKLVVITSKEITNRLSNTSIVRYIQKPLDIFQLKEFIPSI